MERKVLDQIREVMRDLEEFKEEIPFKTISSEEVLDLAFRKGEEVRDKVTGKKGRVITGSRLPTTKV